MIVCGKCGFTQPKDVYCANCGINLEKYKPEKPPKLVRLLKDPYFQISSAIIVAIAAFFIIINKPSPNVNNGFLAENDTFENTNQDEQPDIVPEEPAREEPTQKTKPKAPSFKKQIKALVKERKSGAKSKTNAVQLIAASNKNITAETESKNNEPPAIKGPQKASFSFYEILPGQLDKHFSGGGKVEAVVVKATDFNLGNLQDSRLPMERTWELGTTKNSQLDYMVESLEDGELKGLKLVVQNKSDESNEAKTIQVQVSANIPNKEGSDSSIDWSSSLTVEKDNFVIVKIQLPHSEVPTSFLEDNYNSPLSIMASPQFVEQKTQLLTIISFD